jgi:O-antigen ligase
VIDRISLTVVFILSFLTYLRPELTVSVQLIPLVVFAVLVIVRVFFSVSILQALGSLLEMDGLLFVLLLSVLLLASSIASNSPGSLDHALLFVACLILARLYMTIVPIREVLEAFFWSGVICIALFLPISFSALIDAATQSVERFGFLNLQTNLLGFLLTGYFWVMVWKVLADGWRTKVLAGLVGLCCIAMVFFASSRGSLVGSVVGGVFGASMALIRTERNQRKKLAGRMIGVAAVLLIGVFFVQSSSWYKNTYEFFDQILAISEPSRGIGSGFSGRLDSWSKTLRMLSDGSWLTGRGLRSSDSLYPMIDNGYLVLLYDLGLLPLILITWRFLSIVWKAMKAYFRTADKPQQQLCLSCAVLVVVLLVASVSQRYLFAVGNPYSLLVFILFTTPTSALGLAFEGPANKQNAARSLLNRQISDLQPSRGHLA